MGRKATRYPNVYRRGRVYYFRFRDESGTWRERRFGTDLELTRRAQIQAQNEADAIANRITTREQIEARHNAAASFDEWLKRYETYLEAKGVTKEHRKACMQRCRAVKEALKCDTLNDITPRKVEAMLDAVTLAGGSVRTRNDYLVKLSAFLSWALPMNPIAKLKARSTAADSRRPVRALTPEEFADLLDATPNPRRRFAYLIAGKLGLRWSEIRKIQWGNIDLEAGALTLVAAVSKNRTEQTVPIPPDLLAELRTVPNKQGAVMPHPPIRRTWMQDIARAEIAHVTDAGQADRRCLRKTFITHLAIGGVDLRTAQRLARHSRPDLTSNVYTDPRLLDLRAAMESLDRVQGKRVG